MTKKKPAAKGLEEARELRIAELRGRLGDQVTVYPLEGVWVRGVPHVEQTVDVELADELLAYSPPAFTTVKPEPTVPRETVTGEPGPETVVLPAGSAIVPTPPADAGATDREV